MSNFDWPFFIVRSSDHKLWLKADARADNELDSLDEDPFWDTPTRRRYHAVSGARVSTLNAEDEDIYDYDANAEEEEELAGSEDDYIDF